MIKDEYTLLIAETTKSLKGRLSNPRDMIKEQGFETYSDEHVPSCYIKISKNLATCKYVCSTITDVTFVSSQLFSFSI